MRVLILIMLICGPMTGASWAQTAPLPRPIILDAPAAEAPTAEAPASAPENPHQLPPRPDPRPAVRVRDPLLSDRPIPRPAAIYRVDGARLAEPSPECDAGNTVCIRLAHRLADTCAAMLVLARQEGLPPGYFARLVWRESHFDPYAISHAGALGIAQFIPATAKLRGLADPFNPAAALAASAAYLADLTDRFGNLGLAAAAYNGGEQRVRRFVAGAGGLPAETRAYVQGITGHTAEIWRDRPPEAVDYRLDGETPFLPACIAKGTSRNVPQFPTGSPKPAWAVVIAAHQTKAIAEARLATASARSPTVRAHKAVVTRVRLSSMRSAQYTAQIGQPDRHSALQVCNEIRRSGVPCLVRRN